MISASLFSFIEFVLFLFLPDSLSLAFCSSSFVSVQYISAFCLSAFFCLPSLCLLFIYLPFYFFEPPFCLFFSFSAFGSRLSLFYKSLFLSHSSSFTAFSSCLSIFYIIVTILSFFFSFHLSIFGWANEGKRNELLHFLKLHMYNLHTN